MIEFLYCDRYSWCNSTYVTRDRPADTDSGARARGWHIWDGMTQGGRQTRVVLCNKCVESHRRTLRPAPPVLPGDESLQLEF